MTPNFKSIDINKVVAPEVHAEMPKEEWLTAELIPVKPVYTKEDLEGLEHLNYAAGLPPFLRGPYSAMAVTLLPARKVCRWHSTCPPTAAMTQITNVLWAMWVRPV